MAPSKPKEDPSHAPSLADLVDPEREKFEDESAELPEWDDSARRFAQRLLKTKIYRESIQRRMILHELSPAVECLLLYYAFGKPVEKVQVEDTTPTMETMSLADMKKRAEFLMRVINAMEEDPSSPTTDSPRETSVH